MTRTFAIVTSLWCAAVATGQVGPSVAPAEFERLHKEIRPRTREALWAEIPWSYDLHKARQRAAALGKPLCVWRMAGDPTAVC